MSDTPIQGSTTADKYSHLPLDAQHIVRKLERENAALKQRIIDDNKAYGCEIRDSSGTIWDHAQKLQKENAALREVLEFAVAAYKEEDWPYVLADNFYAVSCVARSALNGKEAQP